MTTISIPGVDYAWSHPGGIALKAAGKKFAARYLSNGASKNLSRSEADDLAEHGISCVVVWESTAKRPLSGRAAGVADAKTAATQATAAGMPASRPIYFAVDFDATKAQMPTVMAYLDGAASVLSRDRTGVYGGYDTVKAALDGGHAHWAWQTRAWSEGRWDSRAHIRQGATETIGGVSCDLNTALAVDFGQWTPGHVPTLEEDMPITDADADKIAAAVAGYAHPKLDVDAKTKERTDLRQHTVNADENSGAAVVSLKTLTAKVDALSTKVSAATTIDYAKLAAALIAAVKES